MERTKILNLHSFYNGKIEIIPKCSVKGIDDFSVWYTPGVAEPCKKIKNKRELVYKYTNKANSVAIISDGSRVLGLGNIGAEASLPVMEGKALLFKYLGGVDAFPVCINTQNTDDIIQCVKWITPSFGGINLEDIESPKCFSILERLRKECEIPVWHDDQQGTAAVTLSALLNALKIVKKKREKVRILMLGAGAANIKITHLIIQAGFNADNIIVYDSKGSLNKNRNDLNSQKKVLANITNPKNFTGDIKDAISGCDILIALSKSGGDVVKKEWIKRMAKDAIVFACANPIPEIWPDDAKQAGARIVATGRSDFPNQVNNSLGFPAIFRGVLDVEAVVITDQMCIRASEAIANFAQKKGISEDYIIPAMDETGVFIEEAVAVATQAIKEKVAKIKLSKNKLYEKVSYRIKRAQKQLKILMKSGIIRNPRR